MFRGQDPPTPTLEAEFAWPRLVAAAVLELRRSAPRRVRTPAALLDHYCLPLVRAAGGPTPLWRLLVRDAARWDTPELAAAIERERADLLRWVTAHVIDFQERGLVLRSLDPETVAAKSLIALETSWAAAGARPARAMDYYDNARDAILSTFTTPRSRA